MVPSLVELCLLNLEKCDNSTNAISLYKNHTFCIRLRYHSCYNTTQFIIVPRYYTLDVRHIICDDIIYDKYGIPSPLVFSNNIDDSIVYISFQETDKEGVYSFGVSILGLPKRIDEYILYTFTENKIEFRGYISVRENRISFYNRDMIDLDRYTDKIFSVDERRTGLPIQYISKYEIKKLIKIEI